MGSLQVELQPLDPCQTLKMKAYHSLKGSIEAMDVYSHRGEIRIDEREISERLGISRTPVREALILLEHEGFVRAVPRRGIVVLRKTRQEIIDLIIAWASLESMAARLFVIHAPDDEVTTLASKLRRTLITAEAGNGHALTRANGLIEIHDAFVGAPGCGMIRDMTRNLLVQMRWINNLTGGHAVQQATEVTAMRHRMAQAIESRDADLASSLIRDHNLDLARHIETCCDFLD